MNHFDLHCDTLGRCLRGRKSILRNDYDLSVERGFLFDKWIQVFAVFLDDDTRGAKAHQRFLAQAEKLRQAMEESDLIVPYDRDNIREGVCNAILAVENGIALGGRLERVAASRTAFT